ncbi:replication protein RepA [Paeniroseomonas aquatica]|uniref:Replication protein RepA n=1 Tax=Paeniroseomonas aquatica TaxID=373043 RepID=A0ABT8A014_9PROT|nr:replication protein RepA [Paeniroseomonas aquatica]MDN3563036.1 replication protein RepA [Paeniroseomonas aquatica]
MGTVHKLLREVGKAKAITAGTVERDVIETAAKYMADEESGLGFVYSGWTQCALPHRRLKDDEPWTVASERVRLVVQPGLRPVGEDGLLESVGVPFGAHARLILLFLQTEALRTGSREVELGGSLRQWMARLGIQPGGSAFRSVREQAERISRCRLSFHITGSGRTSALVNQSVVDKALFIEESDERQGRLSLEVAKLSEGYFEQLRKHPVPLEEAAIKSLANNSAAMDAYIWLAYRLHSLKGDTMVTWKALKAQFGTNYKELYHFKSKWPKALELALAVYPDAKVEVLEAGVVLKPSRPPVAPRLSAIQQG